MTPRKFSRTQHSTPTTMASSTAAKIAMATARLIQLKSPPAPSSTSMAISAPMLARPTAMATANPTPSTSGCSPDLTLMAILCLIRASLIAIPTASPTASRSTATCRSIVRATAASMRARIVMATQRPISSSYKARSRAGLPAPTTHCCVNSIRVRACCVEPSLAALVR